MMKRLLTITAIGLLLLSGCSSNASNKASDGEALYKKSCAACHGDNLEGRVGPTLVNLKSKYSEADLQKYILQGTPRMPANLVSENEAKTLSAWLMEK
jgi:cytochrome c551